MKLTVLGATGGVGRQVVTQALDAGHRVTAYARNPAKLDVTHSDLTVITGELTNRDAVQRAIAGADVVISALGPSMDRKATGSPLVDGARTGTIRAGYLGRNKIRASITRADIAAFLLEQTTDNRFHRAAPAIGN